MKKAATHIEWVISFGIFIVFIISLFVTLKPGYKPQELSGEILLKIFEDSFNNQVYWTIKTTPLFISNCPPVSSMVTVKLCKPNEDPPSCSSTWKFNNNQDTISFTSEGKQDLIYHPTGSEEDVSPKTESSSCSAMLGITEDSIGISIDKLNALLSYFPDSINDLKDKLKYPKRQEFAIKITTADGTEEYKKTSNIEPSNIYAKEFKTYLIDINADKEPITINLQVW